MKSVTTAMNLLRLPVIQPARPVIRTATKDHSPASDGRYARSIFPAVSAFAALDRAIINRPNVDE